MTVTSAADFAWPVVADLSATTGSTAERTADVGGRMSARRLQALSFLIVVAAAGAAACGSEESSVDTAPQASDRTVTSDAVSAADVADAAAELDLMSRAWDATCMEAAGYPELREAADMTQKHDTQGIRMPLAVDPLEAGPYTEEMARRYGVLGTVELFRKDEPGYVFSNSTAHDDELANCRAEFDATRGANTADLLNSVSEFSDDVHRRLLVAIEPAVTALLEARLDCVRTHGFPTLTTNISESMGDLIRTVSIAPGVFSDEPLPALPPRHHDDVSVEPPDAIQTYTPSPSEVAFALAYVACGEDQDFVTEWNSAQVGPRAEIEASEASALEALNRALNEALSA